MKTIFYSWQSDIEGNKSFVNDILEDFVATHDGYRLESAERNNENSPERIDETIINKIKSSNYLIADVSIINPDDAGTKRLTPNPNVLYELGYASALDNVRIIRVCNGLTCRDTKELPFDIRNTRVILEKFNSKHKKNLYSKIESILTIEPKLPPDTVERIEYYLVDVKQRTHNPQFVIMNNGHDAIKGSFSNYFDNVKPWLPQLKRVVRDEHKVIADFFKDMIDEMSNFKKMYATLGQDSYDERGESLTKIEQIADSIADYLVQNRLSQPRDYRQSIEDYYYNVEEWLRELPDETDFSLPAFYKYTEGISLFYKNYIHNNIQDDKLLSVVESIQLLQDNHLLQPDIEQNIENIRASLNDDSPGGS